VCMNGDLESVENSLTQPHHPPLLKANLGPIDTEKLQLLCDVLSSSPRAFSSFCVCVTVREI